MIEFKKKADKIILDRYGIEVEHTFAIAGGDKQTYEKQFYRYFNEGRNKGRIYGFPYTLGAWCNERLKVSALSSIGKTNIRKDVLSYPEATPERSGGAIQRDRPDRVPSSEDAVVQLYAQNECFENNKFSDSSIVQGAKINIVQYLGIAADEPKRIQKHTRPGIILPLVDAGWDETYCRQWCEENNLLSPIYTTSARGGCWFCHNQGVNQLRLLRKEYPDYWELLLKWDKDSPTTFKPDGHTVYDYEKRFKAEDEGKIKPNDTKFKWKQILEDEQN